MPLDRSVRNTGPEASELVAERDGLVDDLTQAGTVTTTYQVSGIGPTLSGRNGESDPYNTDGEVHVLALVEGGRKREEAPTALAGPGPVTLKDTIWHRAAVGSGDWFRTDCC